MEPFKNIFNEKFVQVLALSVKKYENSFDDKNYVKTVLNSLEKLELKDRMRLISSTIKPFLQLSYKDSIEVLKKAKLNVEEINKDVDNLGLQTMIFQDFVEVYGLDDFETSLEALKVFTINSSSEFAIRHFLVKDENLTIKYLYSWMKSPNEHVRRLATEGSRPRLPWAIALPSFKKNPSLVIPILDELKNDESLYVRRSVANNLNDIAKDNEEVVITFIETNLGQNKELDWLLKHGARTLLKKGEVNTLALFGYKKLEDLVLKNFEVEPSVSIGEYLNFEFHLNNNDTLGLLRVEYEIDFLMSNNKRSKKVYMLSQSKVSNKSKDFKKRHSFKKVTTRQFYVGEHFITIIVNGVRLEPKPFILKE